MTVKSESLAKIILDQIQTVLPIEMQPHELHEPWFKGNEWTYVKECIDTGWVSSVGKYVDLFEKKLCEITNSNHAIAITNGTSALHLALVLSDVQRNDEVLVPALTFIGTVNPIHWIGAIPHFVDSENTSLGIDPVKLDDYLSKITKVGSSGTFNKITGNKISALILMHTFGHPCKIDELKAVALKYHLKLIEDAAESIGSTYKNKHTGTFAEFGVLSFNGNKTVTTGGGGAILTQDSTLAQKAKHLSTTAKKPHSWEFFHDSPGFNYRLPNLNAALGVAQLECLPEFLSRKRNLANQYTTAFSQSVGFKFFKEPLNSKSNYWLNLILLDEPDLKLRDQILQSLQDHKIKARPVWNLIPHLPPYEKCPKMDLTCAINLEKRIINLPSSAKYGHRE